jgi:hypothetical protein
VKGIGDVAAKGLQRTYGGIEQIVNVAKYAPHTLEMTQINGKKLGRSKANALCRAFGCEALP